MAGSLGKRIEVLEQLYSTSTRADGPERWREKMAASLRRAEEKAAAEESQGDSRRCCALGNLYKFMERKPDRGLEARSAGWCVNSHNTATRLPPGRRRGPVQGW
jgi:hypothetical protein